MRYITIFLIFFIILGCNPEAEIKYKEDPNTDPFNEEDYLPCPEDMVAVKATCMDRYEASRKDATDSSYGTDESEAISAPNKLPWYENPISEDDVLKFKSACEAVGKRLCHNDEWISSCKTDDSNSYVFGNQFNSQTCNSVDTFCGDHCYEHNISTEDCNIGENCGYQYYCFEIYPTGSFLNCTNSYGTFDINGNVWEIVLSDENSDGYEIKGGAFNCGNPSVRLNCNFSANWKALYAGFRCCKDREKKQ